MHSLLDSITSVIIIRAKFSIMIQTCRVFNKDCSYRATLEDLQSTRVMSQDLRVVVYTMLICFKQGSHEYHGTRKKVLNINYFEKAKHVLPIFSLNLEAFCVQLKVFNSLGVLEPPQALELIYIKISLSLPSKTK